MTAFEEDIHVPLVVRGPGCARRARRSTTSPPTSTSRRRSPSSARPRRRASSNGRSLATGAARQEARPRTQGRARRAYAESPGASGAGTRARAQQDPDNDASPPNSGTPATGSQAPADGAGSSSPSVCPSTPRPDRPLHLRRVRHGRTSALRPTRRPGSASQHRVHRRSEARPGPRQTAIGPAEVQGQRVPRGRPGVGAGYPAGSPRVDEPRTEPRAAAGSPDPAGPQRRRRRGRRDRRVGADLRRGAGARGARRDQPGCDRQSDAVPRRDHSRRRRRRQSCSRWAGSRPANATRSHRWSIRATGGSCTRRARAPTVARSWCAGPIWSAPTG